MVVTTQINVLVSVANSLRSKGLSQHAAEVDRFLRKYAQQLAPTAPSTVPPTDEGPMEDPLGEPLADLGGMEGIEAPMLQPEQAGPEKPNEQNSLQRTFYYQFEKWHSVLDRELPQFDYLGKQNIDAIRSALSGVRNAVERVFQTKPVQYNQQMVKQWNEHINELVKRIRESQKKKLNKTKAIVDTSLLYDTTKQLYESAQRVFGSDPKFSSVLSEYADLMNVFTNVVQNVSEPVARTDLTEVR